MSAKILIVADDDEDVRALVAGSLRRRGFEVVEAADGVELLDYLGSALLEGGRRERRSHRGSLPVALIADVNMPGVSGTDVVGGLRRDGWDLPAILITGMDRTGMDREARRCEALLFHKPLNLTHLCDTVEGLVGAALASSPGASRGRASG